MSSATNETTNTMGRMTMSGELVTPNVMAIHGGALVAPIVVAMNGGALVAPSTMSMARAGMAPTGRMAMTTGPKTADEIAALTAADRAALAAGERVAQTTSDTKRGVEDRAAWAAGEWAIVGARLPAKRARARQHERPVHAKPAAWAAGEWAMPIADANEELD